MRYSDIRGIKKLYFTPRDVARTLNISYASAQVTCSRYVKNGILLRLKRNFYALPEKWDNLSYTGAFLVANILEIPSYISLTSALSFYEITTQIQRDFFESVSLKRTKDINIGEKTFVFRKIGRALYGGFKKIDGYFIATPEKALLDAAYLTSIKRYDLDVNALNLGKIDKKKIKKDISMYPEMTLKFWRKYVGPL